MDQRRVLLAVTGASGSVYARQLLDRLYSIRSQWQEASVVLSGNAGDVWRTELGDEGYRHYASLGFRFFEKNDFSAPFASGSGRYDTMIIAPCSMGTLGRIAGGLSNDLITRAADVVLKERRRLICMVRETPYNLVHIRNMETVTLAGGIICPATPSFYSRPGTVEALVATVVDRVLDLAGFDIGTFRWGTKEEA